MSPLLSVQDLKVHFPTAGNGLFGNKRWVKAVDGVSFELQKGETLGVVGESGCGKSTLARAILQLIKPTAGKVFLDGVELGELSQQALRTKRQDMQLIFQDPLAALNPRMSVFETIAEPLRVHTQLDRRSIEQRVLSMMDKVGLSAHLINRYPHEFSGGQCQRIGIARALITEPQLIICDEPVSALDVSIRAQIINLLTELQQELGLSLIFIAHDLHAVRHISHRIMVMYLGKAVEMGTATEVYQSPQHPYSQTLINSVPILDPKANRASCTPLLEGEPPSPLNPPSGCAFHTRCPLADENCAQTAPVLAETSTNHQAACLKLPA